MQVEIEEIAPCVASWSAWLFAVTSSYSTPIKHKTEYRYACVPKSASECGLPQSSPCLVLTYASGKGDGLQDDLNCKREGAGIDVGGYGRYLHQLNEYIDIIISGVLGL